MSKFLNNINLESGNDIQFKTTAGANAGKIEQDGNNLVISNDAGDVLLGDGASDVYIGDGTNNVDILFEQSGSIKGDGSAVTLTIGGANTTLNLENPNINGALSLGATSISNKLTFTSSSGYILFDHEPSGDTGAYEGTTSVPLLKIDRGGAEKTILERVSEEGGLLLGADDSVIIAAGDTRNTLRSNINEADERVVFASEGGFHAYGFPNNLTDWSNRNEFRFRSDSATASDNGLYIGDGTNVQFIDLSRNLKNIGTIGSGTITSTGHVAATEFRPTNIVTNKVVKFNGTQLDDANITDTGSLITLGSNTVVSGELEATSLDINGNADIAGELQVTTNGTATLILRGDNNNSGDTGQLDSAIKMLHDDGTHGILMETKNFAGKQSFEIKSLSAGTESSRFLIHQDNYITTSGAVTAGGSVTATSFIKSGGTSSQFLKANGNVDGNTYATESYVSTQISNLVDSSPAALNTLNELAAALGDDASFSTTMSTSLGNRLRVDTASQGLNSTQKSNGRTNLGLGTAATSASTAFATSAQGTKADNALPKAGGTMTGALNTGANAFGGSYLSVSSGGVTQWGASRGILTWDTNWASVYASSGKELRLGAGGGSDNSIVLDGSTVEINKDITTTGTVTATGGNSTNWNTAYTDRNKWDGGSTGLNASTGRTSLGLGSAATQNTSAFAAASHAHTFASLTSKPAFVENGQLQYRTTTTPDTAGDSAGVTFNYMGGTATNRPAGTDHSLLTMGYSSNWQTQIAQDWREGGRIYIRGQENSTWSSWSRVHSTDDFSTTDVANGVTAFGWGNHASAGYAPLASPALTGNPTAPTQSSSESSTKIATTAYVKSQGYITSADGGNATQLDGIDSSSFLRSDTADTATGNLNFNGTQSWRETTRWQVNTTDDANQRADARNDDTDKARLHWYGQTDGGTNTNFRHAWYDGINYVNVDVTSPKTVTFDGVISATGGNSTNWNTAYGWGDHASAGYAPLASPALTGSPTAPTPSLSDNNTNIATTEYVKGQNYITTIAAGAVGTSQLATNSVTATKIAGGAVGASELNVVGNGSTAQFLRSDGDGTFTWATPTDTNTTYSVGDGGLTQNNFTNADHTKLNGIATSANNYSLPEATATVRGGIELFSNTDQSVAANSVSATASRTYGIQLNSAGQAVVNVPWVDTNTNTTYSVGDGGLTQKNFTTTLKTKLDGIATSANNYSLPEATSTVRGGIELFSNTDQSYPANAVTDTSGRTYGIQLNSVGQAVVNVPWSDTNTDTNTTYTAGRGLDLSGTQFQLETDLRDTISYIGYDSNDYIQWSNNSYCRTVVSGSERLRVKTDGIDVTGVVVANAIRTKAASTSYSLITRNTGASNYVLYVQATQSGGTQKIATFGYGSGTAGQATEVFRIARGQINAYSSNLTVGGSITGNSKNFSIPHPTKEGKRLVHSCLEGPEIGVYFRGRSQSSTIEMPDYWGGLVDLDSMTVELTAIGPNQDLYVEDIADDGDVTVGSNTETALNYFYVVYGERKDMDKLEIEVDDTGEFEAGDGNSEEESEE